MESVVAGRSGREGCDATYSNDARAAWCVQRPRGTGRVIDMPDLVPDFPPEARRPPSPVTARYPRTRPEHARLGKFFKRVDLTGVDLGPLVAVVERPPIGHWTSYADADWFRAREEACEEVLSEFFGTARPL